MLTTILISSYAFITVGVFFLPSFLPENNRWLERRFEDRVLGAVMWPFLSVIGPLTGLKLLANLIADWTDRRLERKVQALKQFATEQNKQLKLLNQSSAAFLVEETDYRHAHCQSCGQVKK